MSARRQQRSAGRKGAYPWSVEEDRILRENYPSRGPAGWSRLLPGRTSAAVQSRAFILGVKFVRPDPVEVARRAPSTPPRFLGIDKVMLTWTTRREGSAA